LRRSTELCSADVVPSLTTVLAAAALTLTLPSPAPSTTPPADRSGARIISQAARWTGLPTMDELADDSPTMFLISGEIENVGPTPIAWVKLGYELLGAGDDDVVLASEYGYNFRAEALRGAVVDTGGATHVDTPIQPLAPGERDLFRMVFFRADVPRFERWRVRILEVR
jgi:hypothetical protein